MVAIFIVISLAADLFQYLVGTIIWGNYHRRQELRKIKEDSCFDAPRYFNWPTLALFWLKQLAMITAYGMLLSFLLSRLA